jgi:hypothetical protein
VSSGDVEAGRPDPELPATSVPAAADGASPPSADLPPAGDGHDQAEDDRGPGGRERARRARRRSHEWPTVAVLLVALAGLVVAAVVTFRLGTVVLGLACLLGAVLRAVLSPGQVGMLAVRSRWTDVVVLLVLGSGLVVLALSVPLLH